MAENPLFEIARRKYRQCYDADVNPNFASWMATVAGVGQGAVLGFRAAASGPLFLETYLDQPIEAAVATAMGRPVCRDQIVEIGNFAADSSTAMVDLWVTAARDLGGSGAIAVATLTRPLRRMFARLGVPITEISPVSPERLGAEASSWGSYYAQDPRICVGVIADGETALTQFINRRYRQEVA